MVPSESTPAQVRVDVNDAPIADEGVAVKLVHSGVAFVADGTGAVGVVVCACAGVAVTSKNVIKNNVAWRRSFISFYID